MANDFFDGSGKLFKLLDESDKSTANTVNENQESFDSFVKSVCHQGYKANGAVQNTLPAFKAAKENGFVYIECDVMSTSDGVQVMSHDDNIAGYITSEILDSFLISENTFDSIRSYTLGSGDNATKLLSFDEFIYWCKINGMHPYIDFKAGSDSDKVASIIKRHGMDENVTFISTAEKLLSGFPRARFCGLGLSLERCLAIKSDTNHVFTDLNGYNINEETVRKYTSQGIPVEAYTTSDELLIRQLVAWGVSGITTDLSHVGNVVLADTETVIGVSLDSFAETIYVGGTVTIIPTLLPLTTSDTSGVTWESSDESIATVENGVVTGISAGTVTITVTPNANTTNKRARATCTITVEQETTE